MTRLRGSAAIVISITSLFAVSAFTAAAQSTNAICGVQETLQPGSNDSNVVILQDFLIAQGGSIPAGPTGYFGAQTEAALVAFQDQTGIAAAAGGSGVFGSFTRNYIATHFCSSSGSSSSSSSSSSSGASSGSGSGTYYGPSSEGNFNGELSASPASGNAPLTVTFSGVGSSISFGDGTGQNNNSGDALGIVSHVYSTQGTYVASSNGLSAIITVVASTQNGGSSSPAGSISSFNASGPAPLSVTFYVSCANAGTYDVEFGDGTDLGSSAAQAQCNGNLQTVTHTYQSDGSYSAALELLVQGSNGVYSSQAAGTPVNVQVGLGGTVSSTTSFIVSPSKGTAPLTVSFSGNAPYPYQIQTGDNGSIIPAPVIDCAASSTNCPPAFITVNGSHTYQSAGTYQAVLTSNGNAVASSTITVTASSTNCTPSQDLQIGDSDADTNGQVSVLQTFLVNQGATIYPAQLVTGFFGSGTQTGVRNFQMKYGIAQTGTVGPLTMAAMETICKGGTPPVTTSTEPSFSASPTSGNAPLSVTFTAANFETPPAGSSYVVDFGDGSKGATQTVVSTCSQSGSGSCGPSLAANHTYQNGGTYQVALDLEQNLCGGLTTFGCVSDLQEGSTTVTVSMPAATSTTPTTPTTPTTSTEIGIYRYVDNVPIVLHYYSQSSSAAPAGFSLEGLAFHLLQSQVSGSQALYECQLSTSSATPVPVVSSQPANSSYYLSIDPSCEGNGTQMSTLGYLYTTQVSGTIPLYRLYDRTTGDHLTTTNLSESYAEETSYQSEGVQGYVPEN